MERTVLCLVILTKYPSEGGGEHLAMGKEARSFRLNCKRRRRCGTCLKDLLAGRKSLVLLRVLCRDGGVA